MTKKAKKEPKLQTKNKPGTWRAHFNIGLDRVKKRETPTDKQLKYLSDHNLDRTVYVF